MPTLWAVRYPTHRRALIVACSAAVACAPPPPADPALVQEWSAVTRDAVVAADERNRPLISALAAVAMFEAFAADESASLRSLAGQVNGLWSVPPSTGGVDGATAAAEAQRIVLDSMLARAGDARRRVDSLAASHVAARREAGVDEERSRRSVAHGAAVARAVLAVAAPDAPRTLVLRHPQECMYASPKSLEVVPQGDAEAAAPVNAAAAAEARVVAALMAADSAAAAQRASGQRDSCVRALVTGRIRTRG